MFTPPGKGLSGWTPSRSQPRSRPCSLLHICSRRVWWERPVYHRSVPSPLARRARATSGRGRRRARRWRPAGVTPAHGSPRCAARHRHLLPAGCRQRIARIQSAPANSIQGGRVLAGKNRWDRGTNCFRVPQAVSGCLSRPARRARRRVLRVLPRPREGVIVGFLHQCRLLSIREPPSLNSLWAQPTVATAPPVPSIDA